MHHTSTIAQTAISTYDWPLWHISSVSFISLPLGMKPYFFVKWINPISRHTTIAWKLVKLSEFLDYHVEGDILRQFVKKPFVSHSHTQKKLINCLAKEQVFGILSFSAVSQVNRISQRQIPRTDREYYTGKGHIYCQNVKVQTCPIAIPFSTGKQNWMQSIFSASNFTESVKQSKCISEIIFNFGRGGLRSFDKKPHDFSISTSL